MSPMSFISPMNLEFWPPRPNLHAERPLGSPGHLPRGLALRHSDHSLETPLGVHKKVAVGLVGLGVPHCHNKLVILRSPALNKHIKAARPSQICHIQLFNLPKMVRNDPKREISNQHNQIKNNNSTKMAKFNCANRVILAKNPEDLTIWLTILDSSGNRSNHHGLFHVYRLVSWWYLELRDSDRHF